MALPETEAPKLFAHEIIAFNDAELDRYLEENRRGSDIHVHVQDWHNLTSEFMQRLRDRAGAGTAKSRPANLDQVAARLAQLPADREAILRPSSPALSASSATSASSTTTDRTVPGPPKLTAEEEYNENLKLATEAYHELINDGGRPLFPLELLEDVSKNVEKYRESLALPAWQRTHAFKPRDDDWMVFFNQNWRWKNFRALQRYVRQHKVKWIELLFFASQNRPIKWEDKNLDVWIKKPKKPANYNEDYDERYMTPGEEGFPEYVEDMKKRLARHGFTRTFQLDKDPTQQDKLTTWIEYWNYESWWHDRAANYIKNNKRRYDREWKKLVDSKLLQPSELENLAGRNTSKMHEDSVRHYREGVEAERAVNSAKSAVITIQNALRNPHRSRLSPQALQGKLSEAQSKLDMAIAKHEMIEKRHSLVSIFIHRTSEYWKVQRDAERHSAVVQWALQQVPLIELELNTSNAIENGPGTDRRSRKRRRSDLDEEQDIISTSERSHREKRDSYDALNENRPPPKRTRYNNEDAICSNHKPSSSTHATSSVGASGPSMITTAQVAGEKRKLRKRAYQDNLQHLNVPKPRRSARIADLEKRRVAIAAPFDIAKTAPKAPRTSRRKSN